MAEGNAATLQERTATGWLFSLVGGALMAILGVFFVNAGFAALSSLPAANTTGIEAAERVITQGMLVLAAGLLVLFGSAAFYVMPDQRRNWAILLVALSALGWFELGTLAGAGLEDLAVAISIGPVLGLLGGILGLLWSQSPGRVS